MARNRKASFDSAAMVNSLMRDESSSGADNNDHHVFGIASHKSHDDGSSSMTKLSGTSSSGLHHHPLTGGTSALDHLEALGSHAEDPIAIKSTRKQSDDSGGGGVDLTLRSDEHSDSGGTLASSNQRLLLEALMGVTHNSSSGGGGNRKRDRFESWGGMSDLSAAGIGDTVSKGSSAHAAAALAASALHHTGLIDDVTNAAAAIDLPSVHFESSANSCAASAASSVSTDPHHAKVPTKISLSSERKYSLASLSDASAPSHATDNTKEIAPDIQAFVAAAMATVGEQLKELVACKSVDSSAESVASDVAGSESESHMIGSDAAASRWDKASDSSGRPRSLSTSSAFRPIAVDVDAVEAAVNAAQAATGAIDIAAIATMTTPPPVPSSTSAKPKSRKNPRPLPLHTKSSLSTSCCSTTPAAAAAVASGPAHYPPIPQSTVSPRDMEEIRARARAAAGYVPPSADGSTNSDGKRPTSSTMSARQPLKKRAKRWSPPHPDEPTSNGSNGRFTDETYTTPANGPNNNNNNTNSAKTCGENLLHTRFPKTPNTPYPLNTPSSSSFATPRGQSNQKWDDMFDCLLKFVQYRRDVENKGKTEKEQNEWVWDGNVPTTYKTSDGKNLGRWINNQRHAKHKGNLKEGREARLVGTGLKWSVLSTNSWPDMLDELRAYVKEQTKDGKKWDGNVPTNYRIKRHNVTAAAAVAVDEEDDDKNLGRWINRQRSLFQSGKLKKERQLELEKIGLKWSVLSTSSWQSMYDALVEYVNERKKGDTARAWDGNVPANFKTEENPPKSLGRWVNRQRSAFAKNKLKKEFVDKLNAIGLRWAVHERRPLGMDVLTEGDENGSSEGTPPIVQETDDVKDKAEPGSKGVEVIAKEGEPPVSLKGDCASEKATNEGGPCDSKSDKESGKMDTNAINKGDQVDAKGEKLRETNERDH